MNKNYIGIDLGASSGRVSVGSFDGKKIAVNEICRFENRPVFLHDTFYWDFLRLFSEVKNGIAKSMSSYENQIHKMGIDTWGIDFGLIDSQGSLLSNPVSYRDKRTQGMLKEVSKIVSLEDIFLNSGEFIMEINTLFQIYSLIKSNSPLLREADKLLMIPDLFNYFLTGEKFGEFSEVATTSLFDQSQKKWSDYLIKKLSIPSNILPEIIYPGMSVGKTTPLINEELNIKGIEVIATGSHDASSAIAGFPVSRKFSTKKFAGIIIGTWSGLGIELKDKPIINKEVFDLGFSNEGGVLGRFSFQKIISGLWLMQECCDFWNKKEGREISWQEIDKGAFGAPAFKCFIDVDDPVFTNKSSNIIDNIAAYFKKTNQKVELAREIISRTAYEGLVFKYKKAILDIESILGYKIEAAFLTGGGSNNKILCQWISDALGVTVISGVSETTTVGNILMQMKADGEISNMDEGRDIVANSYSLIYFIPKADVDWNKGYENYLKILKP